MGHLSTAARRANWSAPTSHDEMCRRASGRRRHNARRWANAAFRRIDVARRLLFVGFARGTQAQLAREFGVSRSTMSRDVAQILETAAHLPRCPLCGSKPLLSTAPWVRDG